MESNAVSEVCNTAIIGAGPYGLSLAANLSAAGHSFRIFGKPMTTWRGHMPKGMQLKSDGFASNLSSPDPESTLKVWSAKNGRKYDDTLIPVQLADFQDYSAWFQTRYVPMLEDRQVASLARGPAGFTLRLDNGETVEAERVVMTVGINWFTNMPDELKDLPAGLASHSYHTRDLADFAGKKLLILGAGSSAVDMAVLAGEAGADVTLLARASFIRYHEVPDPDAESWLRSIVHPSSGIGPGWRSFVCSNAPLLFRSMPERLRLRATKRHLGPAPGWFMRGKLKARTLLSHTLESAAEQNGRVLVTARGENGISTVTADHVIAATGYRPDLRRLPFLDNGLRARIAHVQHTPRLSPHFETSVPGLYVQGALSANAFGPLMRFMVGAEYAAPRLTAHLVKTMAKRRAVA